MSERKLRKCLRCERAIRTDKNWRLCKDCHQYIAANEQPYEPDDYHGRVAKGPTIRKWGSQ